MKGIKMALKFLLCMIAVPMIAALFLGCAYGILWLIINFYYVVFPSIILGIWVWLACEAYINWFD